MAFKKSSFIMSRFHKTASKRSSTSTIQSHTLAAKDTIISVPEFTSDTVGNATSSPPDTQDDKIKDGTSAGKDGEAVLERTQLYVVVLSLILTTFVISLDIGIVATAIPRITDHFHTLADVGWYGAAYLLANSAIQPLTGKVYTHFSLKYAFFTFLAIFELGSVLAGAANSSKMLVVARAVSGLGSSGLMNGALTIIGVAAPKNRRPIVFGVVMGFFGTGQLIGPLIGGAFTQHLSWRWCFYVNLPIGAATALGMLFARIVNPARKPLQLTTRSIFHSFDIIGFVLFAPACVMLLLAMEWGGIKYAWNSATIIGLICGSAGTFVVFGVWEYHQKEHAMIPTSLIKRRVVYSACLTSALQGGSLIMLGYYLPLYFQIIQHNSPQTSAVHILPSIVSQILIAVVSGALMSRVGYLMPFALLGAACATIGSGLITTFSLTTPKSQWIGYQIFIGGGRGLCVQIPIQIIQASLAPELMPIGTALVSWSQFFGGAIFLGIGQTAFQNFLRNGLHKYAPLLDANLVFDVGATAFQTVVPKAQWGEVELAYNYAITRTYYLTVGAAAASFVTSLGMGMTVSVKDKKKAKSAEEGEQEVKSTKEATESLEKEEPTTEVSSSEEQSKL